MSTVRTAVVRRRNAGSARRRALPGRVLPGRVLLAGSIAAWIAVLGIWAASAFAGAPRHAHGASAPADGTPAPAAPLDALSWGWVGGWMLMVAAMMWPLLAPTVDQVSRASFPNWRWRLTTVTVATSTLLWLVLGLAAGLIAQIAGVLHGSVWWQLAFIGAAAVAWGSATRSRLLWQCSKLPPLAPSRRRGVIGAARAGLVSWKRCALLCGPLMMAMVVGHSPIMMMAASLSVWWEAWHPRAWRDRVPFALIVVAGLGAVAEGVLR